MTASASAPGSVARTGAPRWLRVARAAAAELLLWFALFAGAVWLGWVLIEHHIVKPRMQQTAHAMAAQISGLRAAYAALPPEERPAYLAAVRYHSQGLWGPGDPTGAPLGEPFLASAREVVNMIRERLPGVPIRTAPWPYAGVWVALGPEAQPTGWLGARLQFLVRDLLPMFAGAALLVLAVGIVLLHRVRQRLAWLGAALDEVDAQAFGMPPGRVPDAMPDDAVEQLRLEVRRVAERMTQVRDEQEVLMSRAACDLRVALQTLREAQPRSPDAVQVARHIDSMVATAGTLDLFAGAASATAGAATHLNELLTALAQARIDQVPGVLRWQLGAVPYAGISQVQARRLFSHLLDIAYRHGGGELEVSTRLERNWIVVSLLDRRSQTAPHLAGGWGESIGLQVAQQIAQAHGGCLDLNDREDAGLEVQVWLPPARLT